MPCTLMMLTRLAVGLEPLNALDAAHRAPRSAPLTRAQNLVPPLDRPLADPLSETKNWQKLLTGRRCSQMSHSLPAHLERFIGDEAVTDSRLGLDETWTCRIAFNLLAKVGDINAEILAVLFRFQASDFAKDVAVCVRTRPGCLTNNRSRRYSVAVSLISRLFLILSSDFFPRWDAVAKDRKGGFSSEKLR